MRQARRSRGASFRVNGGSKQPTEHYSPNSKDAPPKRGNTSDVIARLVIVNRSIPYQEWERPCTRRLARCISAPFLNNVPMMAKPSQLTPVAKSQVPIRGVPRSGSA